MTFRTLPFRGSAHLLHELHHVPPEAGEQRVRAAHLGVPQHERPQRVDHPAVQLPEHCGKDGNPVSVRGPLVCGRTSLQPA